jgi:hypothetical protein
MASREEASGRERRQRGDQPRRIRDYRTAASALSGLLGGLVLAGSSWLISSDELQMTAEEVTALATALAAIGTVGTLVAALVQIRRERTARTRLEREAQLKERRSQAERVSAWPLGHGTEQEQPIALSNGSMEPVYRAVAYLVFIHGGGAAPRTGRPRTGREVEEGTGPTFRVLLSVVPPGRHRATVSGGWGGMFVRPGVELAFTDAGPRSRSTPRPPSEANERPP